MVGGDPHAEHETNPALAYLEALDDATMTLAWRPVKTPEDRRRLVLAATIFGRRFEERMGESPPESLDERVSGVFSWV